MGILYEKVVRPAVFRLDAEKAHDLAVAGFEMLRRLPPVYRFLQGFNLLKPGKPVDLFGVKFPNLVGLAAGMDKNGEFWRVAPAFGFGHVEIGTVTYGKQPGNPRPRIFRYPEEEALINRMGFNNAGANAVAQTLKRSGAASKRPVPLGISIGKTRTASIDDAVEDYLGSFHLLVDYADYLALNVSSPNTPDLRRLQESTHLPQLLGALREANLNRARKLGAKPVPLLLKVAPDLTFRQVDFIVETLLSDGFAGVIATNTTLSRPGSFSRVKEEGGLSGRPLHRRALDMINYIHRSTEGKLPIIGVGGAMDPVSAGALVDAGASLVQIYTGWVYRGPFFPKEVARALGPRQQPF